MKKIISALIAIMLVASMSFSMVAAGTIYAQTDVADGNAETVFKEILTGESHAVIKDGYLDMPVGNGTYIETAVKTPAAYTWKMDIMAYDPELKADTHVAGSDGEYRPQFRFMFGGANIVQFLVGYDFKTEKFFAVNTQGDKEEDGKDKPVTIAELPYKVSLDEFHTFVLKVRSDMTVTLYFDGIDVLNFSHPEVINAKGNDNAKTFQKLNVGLAYDNIVIASEDYDEFEIHEHDWHIDHVYQEATFTQEGDVDHTCNICGISRRDIIPKIPCDGHIGGTATCTEKAICEKCKEPYGELAAHTFGDWVVVKEPTGTKEGVKEQVCSVCGAKKQEKIDSLNIVCTNHQGGTATCTERAICEICKDPYGDLLPHTWDDGVVTKEPTATEDGIKTYTCSVCGTTKTEIIAKLGDSQEPTTTGKPDKNNPNTSAVDGLAVTGLVSALAAVAVIAKKKF